MPDKNIASIRYFTEHSFLKPQDKDNVTGFGFAKQDRFWLQFYDPNKVQTNFELDVNLFKTDGWLTANVVSVDVPEFSLSTEEAPHRHKITQRNPPGDLSMVFYDSYDRKIRRQMYRWINNICQDDADPADYRRNYFDECVINMRVYALFDSGGISVNESDYFIDMYPTSVGNVDFNTSTENEIGTTTVQFKYRRHIIEESQSGRGIVTGVGE